eukprot:4334548-Prymnesium_polylepis.1
MQALDRLEGHPNFYRRQEVTIEGESKKAWIYLLFTPGRHKDVLKSPAEYPRVPNGDWMAYMTAGKGGR